MFLSIHHRVAKIWETHEQLSLFSVSIFSLIQIFKEQISQTSPEDEFWDIKAGDFHSQTSKWRPLGDSNPCYRRERAVSWASRRRGHENCLSRVAWYFRVEWAFINRKRTALFSSASLPTRKRLAIYFSSDNLCEHFKERFFKVRRWSNRRFPYGYLVTTSPQSWITKW